MRWRAKARDWHCVPMSQVYFDERIAQRYEVYWPHLFSPEAVDPVVGFLAGLAADGGALEFRVGTGRIALPLSQRGTPVHGVYLSPSIIPHLQANQGADHVP